MQGPISWSLHNESGFFYGLVHSGLEPIQLLPLLRVAGVNLSIPLTVKSQHIKWLLGLALIFHTR